MGTNNPSQLIQDGAQCCSTCDLYVSSSNFFLCRLVETLFYSSLPPVVCGRVHILSTLCVCACPQWCPQIVLVFSWFFVSSSCVPYAAIFSGLSIFDCLLCFMFLPFYQWILNTRNKDCLINYIINDIIAYLYLFL